MTALSVAVFAMLVPATRSCETASVTMFVMARLRGDRTDSMRGTLRAGHHGWDAVYTLNGELYI